MSIKNKYKVKSIDHIVDGDTFDCTLDLGFNISHKIRVRMYGINTPESRTRDLEEKARGLASKARLTDLLEYYTGDLIITTHKKGKYGRVLGVLYANDTNLNSMLVDEGHAQRYYGEKR